MHPFNARIEQALTARAEQGLYRQRTPLARQAQGRVAQQQSYVNFSSNDYLIYDIFFFNRFSFIQLFGRAIFL